MEKFMKVKKLLPLKFINATRQAIEQMTEATNDHLLTPELCLRLVTSKCPLWNGDHKTCPFPDPFWAFYWPGGEGLTRYLLDNQDIIRGKHVLDVGSGCGSLSIAATKLGVAATVTANDIDPIAAVAIQLNATLNGCQPEHMKITIDNLIGTAPLLDKYDCVLLGDMFYNEEFNNILIKWLLSLLNDKVEIFIGDPGRHMKFFQEYSKLVEKVAEYEVSEEYMKVNDLQMRQICVWKLCCR